MNHRELGDNNNRQEPVAVGGNPLFRSMMASCAAALEVDPQTLQPVGQRAARMAAIHAQVVAAQEAAEQTYAGNIAYAASLGRQAVAAEAFALDALVDARMPVTTS